MDEAQEVLHKIMDVNRVDCDAQIDGLIELVKMDIEGQEINKQEQRFKYFYS